MGPVAQVRDCRADLATLPTVTSAMLITRNGGMENSCSATNPCLRANQESTRIALVRSNGFAFYAKDMPYSSKNAKTKKERRLARAVVSKMPRLGDLGLLFRC
jgi:hypothetical protein